MNADLYLSLGARPVALERSLAWLTVFLVFLGDVRIPVGTSLLYFPLALVPAGLLLALKLASASVFVPFGAVALSVVLMAGALSGAVSDLVSLRRSLAAVFPVFGALLAVCALAGTPGLMRVSRSAIFWGGGLLSAWVILLSFRAAGSGLPFYEAKLLIETPLGRSNYLAAFLLFLVAAAWRHARWLSVFGAVAILAALSRGGLLALAFFLFFLGLSRWRLGVPAAAVATASAIALIGVLSFADVGVARNDVPEDLISGLASPASAGNRVVLWQAARTMIESSPLFGVGPNGFRTIVEQSPQMEDVWGPHNTVFLLWLNYGLLGLLAYCTYLALLLRSVFRAEPRDPANHAQSCGLLALILFSLFEPLVGSASFEVLLATAYAASLPTWLEVDTTT